MIDEEPTDMVDDETWSSRRATLLDQLADWVDTVGETSDGRDWLEQWAETLRTPSLPPSQEARSSPSLTLAVDGEAMLELTRAMSGLMQVTSELTALRHDLKGHTKQSRDFAQQMATQADQILTANSATLDQLLASHNGSAASAANGSAGTYELSDRGQLRPYLMAVIESDESVSRLKEAVQAEAKRLGTEPSVSATSWLGRKAVERAQSQWTEVWTQHRQRLQGLADGLRLTEERISNQLNRIGIQRIGRIGDEVDPHTMQVLEVIEASQSSAGTVAKVLRGGYCVGDWVLQPAQVAATAASQPSIPPNARRDA